MKKLVISLLIFVVIFIAGCKQPAKKGVTEEKEIITEMIETTGDVTVDAVGNDLNNVNNVENDLNSDKLNDVDSGLSEIQNI